MFSTLTSKQKRFVEEYLIDLNAAQAAIRAGYSKKSARKIGSENLSKLDIQIELTQRIKERRERSIISADQVIFELVQTINVAGQTVPVMGADGDILYYKTLDPQSHIRACELLGRHLGMWGKAREIEPRPTGEVVIMKNKNQD